MLLKDLLASLSNLKSQITSTLQAVEQPGEILIDDHVASIVEKCTQSLSHVQNQIENQVQRGSYYDKTHKVNSENKKLHNEIEQPPKIYISHEINSDFRPYYDPKFERGEGRDSVHGVSVTVLEDSFDLDALEFDDFVGNTSEFNTSHGASKPVLCDERKEQSSTVLTEVSYDESTTTEKGQDVEHDSGGFDDFEFSTDALEALEEAERSALQDYEDIEVDHNESDDIHQPTESTYLDVLKQYFGYSKFRPMQWKIINSILNEKRDNCVIMATGYGKSLTFQFPSVFSKRTTIVISPLISLMEDQVHGLQASNIEACFLGSAQQKSSEVKADVFKGRYRLVYSTPEFALSAINDFKKLDQAVGIELIAIDEAHCVSQWGHDFRSSYRQLGILKSTFPKVPILAVTATATAEVQKDICRSLKLINPNMTCTGFDRPNLFLDVAHKCGDMAQNLKTLLQRDGYQHHFDGPTIIYCPTKKTTEEVASVLKGLHVSCLAYHASMSLTARKKTHHDFLNDQIQVVVATVAFGMGIDKPDVRRVIHYGAPKDIESYYQEIGRAGRDGLPSTCTVIFSKSDFNISRSFLNDISSETFRNHKLSMMNKMEQYLNTTQCRRKVLLSYFQADKVDGIGGTENCCDSCRRRIISSKHGLSTTESEEGPRDYSKEAIDLFRVIEMTGNRFGLGVPSLVLGGSSNKKAVTFKSSKLFGCGKYKSQKFWCALGKSLIYEGYLRERSVQGSFGATVELTQQARSWLNSGDKSRTLIITPNGELLQEDAVQDSKAVAATLKKNVTSSAAFATRELLYSPTSTTAASSTAAPSLPPVDPETQRLQAELYTKLVKLRNDMSQDTGFTPHNIASNRLLLDMVKLRPSNKAALLKLEDFSEVKANRFGEKFTTLIKSFCEVNSVKLDDFPEIMDDLETGDESMKKSLMKLTETQQTSYIMFSRQKHSLEQVATQRGLKTSTIITHLCEALKEGLEVDPQHLGVTPQIEKVILNVMLAPPISGDLSSLTKIKDQLPMSVEYNHIKVVIAQLVQKYGQSYNAAGLLVLANMPSICGGGTDHITSKSQNIHISLPQRKREISFMSSSLDSPPTSKLIKYESSPVGMQDFPQIPLRKSVSDFVPASRSHSQSPQQSPPAVSSQSLHSQDLNQTDSQSTYRKLPMWMATSTNKTVLKKKMKSNSLFK